MLLKLERGFDKFADAIGYFTDFVMVLMILNFMHGPTDMLNMRLQRSNKHNIYK